MWEDVLPMRDVVFLPLDALHSSLITLLSFTQMSRVGCQILSLGYALISIRPFQFISFDDAAGFRNEMMCSRRRALSPTVFERCLRALSSSAVAVEIGCAPGMTPCRMLNHVTVLLSPSSRELAPIPRLMLRYHRRGRQNTGW